MWSWLASHDALVVALQLGVWLALALITGPRLLAEARALSPAPRAAVAVLGLVAVAICALWFPTFERFMPLGHEASYSECYYGQSTPASAHGWQPYVTYPVIRWGYWALGGLLGREELTGALAFNMAVRGVTVVLFGLLARALFRRDAAAVAAALLLTVHPTHAFWGTSIYNVAIPSFFVVLCLLQSVLAWREGDRLLLAAAAASGCLVVATRVEWGILAPSLALLLFVGLGAVWGRHPKVRTLAFWAGPLTLVFFYGVSILAGAGALTTQGGYHDALGYVETMGRQAWILDYLAPLDGPLGLFTVALGVAWCVRGGHGRLGWALLGFALLSHCALATFNDFAYRHDLLPGFGLLLLAAGAAGWLEKSSHRGLRVTAAGFLAATAVVGLVGVSANVERYYTTVEEFQERHPGFQSTELSSDTLEDGSCYLITDNERLWEMKLAGSHFNLMEPGEAATHWRDHDRCIYWLYDVTDYRVDGLAVRARALKLLTWFDWEPAGHASFPDGNEAVVYRMTSPPWGLEEPPADWRWGEDEIGGEEEGGSGAEPDVEEVGGDEERAAEEVGGDEERAAEEVQSTP
ncbi:MAG: hypothetical protein KDA24_27765 [Deltaproteobacteria bacterium]|nr:hypothetical protein [Deltaproteobacteria bacterium]